MLSVAPPGTRIAGRFLVEAVAGRGGMGTVYRAHDEETGRAVALKLMLANRSDRDLERFSREGDLLSRLRHPGIVAHVAHGVTETMEPYLAMEWLTGEDLGQRIHRGPLDVAEALTLLKRVAEALAVAHELGVVHRDIKPNNLFLRDGQAERVAIVDFGIARRAALSSAITRTGAVMGTPGYMAPEQARGDDDMTPAVDVFSLGCVLFESLTGKPPFMAEQPLALLAKILFDEPPRLCQIRPDLPAAVEALIGRMLAKDPADRLRDAQAVLDAMATLDDLRHGAAMAPWTSPPSEGRMGAEQHLISVLFARPEGAAIDPGESTLVRELAEHGARALWLADGALVATLIQPRGAATDQASLLARCALLIKARWPSAKIALSTGRGQLEQSSPTGEVLDRAAALLRDGLFTDSGERILLDELTSGLLHERFRTHRTTSGARVLTGEDLDLDASRPLLGKPTPCVGRDVELGMLESSLQSCIEDARPLAVLVTAPPGTGKSRLRHELLRRVEARGEDILILIGRGDPMTAGSAYGLLGQAARRLSGILDGESAEERRNKLARRIGERVPSGERARVVAFIGEVSGVPFPDEDNMTLRAARRDPLLMSDQITIALLDFLRAECAARPTLLVLEDLHWGDALTVKLCETAIEQLGDRPLMVLALARPEVSALFPRLGAGAAQVMQLRPLSKRASERLAQQVLGDQVSRKTIERIVAQAEGNALFLEELIRAAADGRGQEVPETVLAILQARIGRLELGARRALRAASVFGETSWLGGIQALLGASIEAADIERWIHRLCRDEILEERRESRFSGERELRFRHALMRDAAYGLLTDDDRALSHRLAGQYLEATGEQDPLVLAEHHHRGGDLESAARFYVRAAGQLFDRQDMQGAERCIDAGIACGASGEERVELSALSAIIAFFMDNDPARACAGRPILAELPAGCTRWCKLIGVLIVSSATLGRQRDLMELSGQLLGTDPDPDALGAYMESVAFLVSMFCWLGLRKEAGAFLSRLISTGAAKALSDPFIRGWMCHAQSCMSCFFGEDPGKARLFADEGTEAFRQIGDHRNQVAPQALAGFARALLGDQTGAEEALREALTAAERHGQAFPIGYAKKHLAWVLSNSGEAPRRAEARALAQDLLSSSSANLLQIGVAHDALARVAAREGDIAEAEAHAREACALLTPFLSFRLFALETLNLTLLAAGRTGEAREIAALGAEIADATSRRYRNHGGPHE